MMDGVGALLPSRCEGVQLPASTEGWYLQALFEAVGGSLGIQGSGRSGADSGLESLPTEVDLVRQARHCTSPSSRHLQCSRAGTGHAAFLAVGLDTSRRVLCHREARADTVSAWNTSRTLAPWLL